MSVMFKLWGRAPWENVEVEEEELKYAKVGDSWSAQNWDSETEATVVRKKDDVTTVVTVRFESRGFFTPYTEVYEERYEV